MNQSKIPDWKDMPKSVTLATLSWEDVYLKACQELERTPTRKETVDMFNEMAHSMRNATQDDMPAQLDALIPEIVKESLKSNPYNAYALTAEQITSKKYCHECQEIQGIYWELNHCEKNPQGIDLFADHGNGNNNNNGDDNTCEDRYCNPKSTVIEEQYITPQYIARHAVYERCVQCHQYLDSAGPQQTQQTHLVQCPNCNGTGIFDTCKECGGNGPGCIYCIVEDGDQSIVPGKDCMMCGGYGKINNTTHIRVNDRYIFIDVKCVDGTVLSRCHVKEISEAFRNQNIADWVLDGNDIQDNYVLSVDGAIEFAKDDDDNDDQRIIVSITSKGKDYGCLYVYGLRETS